VERWVPTFRPAFLFGEVGQCAVDSGMHLALWVQLGRWQEDRGLGFLLLPMSTSRIREFLAVRVQTHRHMHSAKALAPGWTSCASGK